MSSPPEPTPVIATALAARQPLAEVAEQAQLVESLGYRAIWVPEIAGRDAMVACALLADRTKTIGLATGIAPIGARGPALTAMAAATVAEAAPGRFRLGIGIGHAETAGPWFGARRPARLGEMETALREIRALLEGGESAPGLKLRGVHPPQPPPIVLGALSEGLATLAGRLADGILLNWVTAARAAELVAACRRGAEEAGRDPGSVRAAAYVPVCVSDELDAAQDQLARQVAAYGRLGAYRRSLERCGFASEAALLAELGPREPERVPRGLLSALGAIGPLETVRERLAEFRRAGVEEVVAAPVPLPGAAAWPSMVATWTALAPA